MEIVVICALWPMNQNSSYGSITVKIPQRDFEMDFDVSVTRPGGLVHIEIKFAQTLYATIRQFPPGMEKESKEQLNGIPTCKREILGMFLMTVEESLKVLVKEKTKTNEVAGYGNTFQTTDKGVSAVYQEFSETKRLATM